MRGGRDYRIASGGGRMYITMDRYSADWPMVERGWKHHVLGEGRGFRSATEAIQTLRDENPGMIDQDLLGFVVVDDSGKPVGPIRDGAAVVLFNFRGDRALELTRAFTEASFTEFDRGPLPDVAFVGHDGIRRRSQASASTIWSSRPPSTARWASTSRAIAGDSVRMQRNAEVRSRDVLLERQPHRNVR